MDIRFASVDLDRLETDPGFNPNLSIPLVRAYRKVINAIRAAVDERNLYQVRSLRFEKLKGDRCHQRSLRLNDQWRLIVEIEDGSPKNTVVVIGIEDYH
jgi:toxin HigB-1